MWPFMETVVEKYFKNYITEHPSGTIEDCVKYIVHEVGGASYHDPSDPLKKEKRSKFEKDVFGFFIDSSNQKKN